MCRKRSNLERSTEERLPYFSFCWRSPTARREYSARGKIHCPDVHDADLLVRYPRALRDDRDPDHSRLPDDLLSVPADVDAEFDHLYRVPAPDGLGGAGLDLFSTLIDHKCHDLKRLIKRIFDRVALANLDDTDIARVDLGLGVIVVLKIPFP